jgi:ribosomal protein S7
MSDVDFTPQPGSFLWAVQQAHPNEDVKVANYTGKASSVSRDVRQMLAEIEALRAENKHLSTINGKLVGLL